MIQQVLANQDIYDKLVNDANEYFNWFDITKNIYLLEQIIS